MSIRLLAASAAVTACLRSSAKMSDVVSRLAWDAPRVHPGVAMSKLVGAGGGCHASDGAILEAQASQLPANPGAHLPHGCHGWVAEDHGRCRGGGGWYGQP
jgi:hypothetical protein